MTEPVSRQHGVRVLKVKIVPHQGYVVRDTLLQLSRGTDLWRAKHGLSFSVTKDLFAKAVPDARQAAARSAAAGYNLRNLFGATGKVSVRPMALGVDQTTARLTDRQDPPAASQATEIVEQWFGHAVQIEDEHNVWADLQAPNGEREQALFTSEDFTQEQWPEILTGRTFKYTRRREIDGSTSTEVREIEILHGEPVPENRRQEARERARELLQHARRDA